MIKFIAIALLLALSFAAETTTTPAIPTDTPGLQKYVDDNKSAYSKAKFNTAMDNCYKDFKTYFDGLSTTDATLRQDISREVGFYQKCTTGKTDYILSGVTNSAFTNGSAVGDCLYVQNTVDGSDQLRLNKAIKRCYNPEQLASGASKFGHCSMKNAAQLASSYASATLTENVKINGDAAYNTFFTCVEQAVFFTLPYTERQFYECEDKCKTDNSPTIFTSGHSETAYSTCLREKYQCARFQVISSEDATSPMYAKFFEECYDNLCYKELTEAANTAFATCMKKCDRPDYSYKLAPVSGSILKVGIMLVLGVVFALF